MIKKIMRLLFQSPFSIKRGDFCIEKPLLETVIKLDLVGVTDTLLL